ncbi:hypothetical protein [Oryza sativa Japonica Group]|uniref:Uncharacterized protein n=1 Tax=Oryza sativa subsp. japonica TaxID=39947 RepID=Q5JLI3_ORYSJ|nr:hypothetical protein [Oryza sativa Japonica Group]
MHEDSEGELFYAELNPEDEIAMCLRCQASLYPYSEAAPTLPSSNQIRMMVTHRKARNDTKTAKASSASESLQESTNGHRCTLKVLGARKEGLAP